MDSDDDVPLLDEYVARNQMNTAVNPMALARGVVELSRSAWCVAKRNTDAQAVAMYMLYRDVAATRFSFRRKMCVSSRDLGVMGDTVDRTSAAMAGIDINPIGCSVNAAIK